MPDNIFFTLPYKPSIKLRLPKNKMTFYNDYCGRNVLTAKEVAQIGFDICECASKTNNVAEAFKSITGIELSEGTISASKYAPVEAKVFGIINESTAVFSLGVLLRDLLISTGRSDMRLRAILDKACDRYTFMRYEGFANLKEDLAIYLKTEVDEEVYGVVIAADKPLPEPIYMRHSAHLPIEERDEAPDFKPYSTPQILWHALLKHLPTLRVKAVLAAFFILFSSIAIPVTSVRKSHDVPTLNSTENYEK